MYKLIVLYDKACKEAQKKNYIMMNTLIGERNIYPSYELGTNVGYNGIY